MERLRSGGFNSFATRAPPAGGEGCCFGRSHGVRDGRHRDPRSVAVGRSPDMQPDRREGLLRTWPMNRALPDGRAECSIDRALPDGSFLPTSRAKPSRSSGRRHRRKQPGGGARSLRRATPREELSSVSIVQTCRTSPSGWRNRCAIVPGVSSQRLPPPPAIVVLAFGLKTATSRLVSCPWCCG